MAPASLSTVESSARRRPTAQCPTPATVYQARPKAKPRHPKELVSAMTKCHRTIEIIRGVPTGRSVFEVSQHPTANY